MEVDKGRSSYVNETNTKLSKLAGVGKETYRMGAKILNSDNEKLKQEVLLGEKSINAGYKELTGKKENQYYTIVPKNGNTYDNIRSATVSQNGNAQQFTEWLH